MKITLLKVCGCLSVYRREGSELLPKYFVLREGDGNILEEFRHYRSALNWALANC